MKIRMKSIYIGDRHNIYFSNGKLNGYYEFKFIDKTINRRYFVNDNPIGVEKCKDKKYYHI